MPTLSNSKITKIKSKGLVKSLAKRIPNRRTLKNSSSSSHTPATGSSSSSNSSSSSTSSTPLTFKKRFPKTMAILSASLSSFPARTPRREVFNARHEMPSSCLMPNDIDMDEDPSNATSWPSFAKPIYVVSIRRNRMDKFTRRMGPWVKYCRRFPCTDGRFIDKKQWTREGKYDGKLTNGQLGAAFSHYRIWRSISLGSYSQATVFEDDVDLNYYRNGKEVVVKMRQAMKELEKNNVKWEFIAWGHGPWADAKNIPLSPLTHWKKPGMVQGFFAYTMKKSLASKLIKQALPIRSAIDCWFYSKVMKNHVKAVTLHPTLFFVVSTPSETTKMMP